MDRNRNYHFGAPSIFNNEWLNDFNTSLSTDANWITDVNTFEDKGDYYELNISLPIVGDSLTVSVEDRTVNVSYEEKNKHSSYSGSYQFSLPGDSDENTVEAELGVVNDNTVTITVKKIEVKPNTSRKLIVRH